MLPAANLVRVPDDVGLDGAAIAADAIATPYHVFAERAPLLPGQTVAVIGAGGGVGVHMAGMASTLTRSFMPSWSRRTSSMSGSAFMRHRADDGGLWA